jgi:hypothetical protein
VIAKEVAVTAAEALIPGLATVNAVRTFAAPNASGTDKTLAGISVVGSAVPVIGAVLKGTVKLAKAVATARKVSRTTNTVEELTEASANTALAVNRAAVTARAAGMRTAKEAGISAADAARIQNAATRTKQRIAVVGSRAKGTAKPGSDWDYVMSGKSAQRHSASSSVPRGSAGGEVNRPGVDVWQDYNPKAPGYNVVDPNRPHVIFDP